ncbi:unnamed protein product [Boreogadus saida]
MWKNTPRLNIGDTLTPPSTDLTPTNQGTAPISSFLRPSPFSPPRVTSDELQIAVNTKWTLSGLNGSCGGWDQPRTEPEPGGLNGTLRTEIRVTEPGSDHDSRGQDEVGPRQTERCSHGWTGSERLGAAVFGLWRASQGQVAAGEQAGRT